MLIIITAVAIAALIGVIVAFVTHSRRQGRDIERCNIAWKKSDTERRDAVARPSAIGLQYHSSDAAVLKIIKVIQEFLGRSQSDACNRVADGFKQGKDQIIGMLAGSETPVKCSDLFNAIESEIDNTSKLLSDAMLVSPAHAAALIRGVTTTALKASCDASTGNIDPKKLDNFLSSLFKAFC